MKGGEAIERGTAQAEALPFDAPTVLVVDDRRTNLDVIGRRLGPMGYRAVLAQGGAAALDLLRTRAFDLVLLDMEMPGVSGLRMLQELRRMPRTAELPVLMMTARSDPDAVVEALDAGADDQLAKPFDFAVLRARIERLLARAAAMTALRRANVLMDARIAHRAMELGELKQSLAEIAAERSRLACSLRILEAEIERLSGRTSAAA